MAPKAKRLLESQWKKLKPACEAASAYSENAIKAWAKIAAEAMNGDPQADWRWLLADLRNRCIEDPKLDCPYTVTYLVQLAQTYQKVEGNFDRDVPMSVLIEGRNLDNLTGIIKPGMTVSHMKALVYKSAHPDSPLSVEEIEEEQKRKRLDGRTKRTIDTGVEEIEDTSSTDMPTLLLRIKKEATAYRNTLDNARAEGVDFDPKEIRDAHRAVKDLYTTLEELVPVAA